MRYFKIGVNWFLLIILGYVAFTYGEEWLPFINQNKELSIGAFFSLISSLFYSFNRRISTKKQMNNYFSENILMNPPKNKLRYSDRMAYILAEISELAYYSVEKDNFIQFLEEASKANPNSKKRLAELVSLYKNITRTEKTNDLVISNEEDLSNFLKVNNFEYKGPYLNSGSAQGFICLWNDRDFPFIVVAFRGSEKKIEDWLTNVDAVPASSIDVKNGKVHSGFYNDFKRLKETIENRINEIHQELGEKNVPVFFTGHSLGGALASIATKEVLPDGNGACYTYGAPRVGDYEYFEFVKTPIYRIVNSSDIVPRVPPGVWSIIIGKILAILRFLLVKFESITKLLIIAENWIDQLKEYRHFGDLRYLTDVPSGKFEEAMLLRNPNYFDINQWFWRHIIVSLGMTIKNHNMTIYRKKLAAIGIKRMKNLSIGKSLGYFESSEK